MTNRKSEGNATSVELYGDAAFTAPREQRGDNHGEDWDASPDPKPVAGEQETTPPSDGYSDRELVEALEHVTRNHPDKRLFAAAVTINRRAAEISRLTESLASKEKDLAWKIEELSGMESLAKTYSDALSRVSSELEHATKERDELDAENVHLKECAEEWMQRSDTEHARASDALVELEEARKVVEAAKQMHFDEADGSLRHSPNSCRVCHALLIHGSLSSTTSGEPAKPLPQALREEAAKVQAFIDRFAPEFTPDVRRAMSTEDDKIWHDGVHAARWFSSIAGEPAKKEEPT